MMVMAIAWRLCLLCLTIAGDDSRALEEYAPTVLAVYFMQGLSVQPVTAFSSTTGDFVGQVQDMVEKTAPTTEGDIIARKLDCALRHLLRHALVEAESAGFESGDGTRGSASGVATPPIDLVLNVWPLVIAEIRKKHASRLLPRSFELDKRTLQKFALRAATDDHVYAGGPMSRRSSLVDLGGF